MSLFLITFFTVYGSIHFYFFLKFRSAFASLSSGCYGMFGLFLLLLLLSPVLIHVIESYHPNWPVQIFARLSYVWMGFLFLFFCLSLTNDLYTGAVFLIRFLSANHIAIPPPGTRTGFLACICLSVLICVYGFYEAYHIRIDHLVIPTTKLSSQLSRFRIVQISDLHLGLMTEPEQINRIVQAIKKTKPDLLVCTGDLIDGQPDSFAPQLDPLRHINPPYGKYAVTGNHEFYVGIERAVMWLKWSGFKVLRGETADVAGLINLVGVDDHEAFRSQLSPSTPKTNHAMMSKSNRFTVFLKHRPLIDPDMQKIADLQLSGHTHQGQIFPFGLITRLFFPYHSGTYTLENGFQLHVSRGTGTWGPPMRFLAPPEISVIDLVRTGKED
ncbi:MAG: metallophosphoesterase [Syntrophaceae bacterium]|nr:metallophosphoesterase [Syntrophaceae bacterium]